MSTEIVYDFEYLNKRLKLRGGDLYWRTSPYPRKVGTLVGQKPMHNGYKGIYFSKNGNGKLFPQHRVIWLLANGDWPKGEIDHIDGDKLNNDPANLRDVSRAENARNLKLNVNNTSGCSGVKKCGNGWVSIIGQQRTATKSNGRYKYFKNKDDAIAWRKAKEIEYGYHANHGRKA